MYKMTVGRERVRVYEAHEVVKRLDVSSFQKHFCGRLLQSYSAGPNKSGVRGSDKCHHIPSYY
jgi:hypothetical protein